MLTNKAKYGLKALVYLATHEGPCVAEDIANANNIPRLFLNTILVELRKAGILASQRGKHGGYYLGYPADRIMVGQIIRVLEGSLAPIACVSRTAYRRCNDCPDEAACEIRDLMMDVRNSMTLILDRTAIVSLKAHGTEPSPAGINGLGLIEDLARTEKIERKRLNTDPSKRKRRVASRKVAHPLGL